MNRHQVLRYGKPLLAFAVAFWLSRRMGPVFVPAAYLLFLAVVLISAWWGGLRAGLLATALSAWALAFVVLPSQSGREGGWTTGLRLAAFLAASVLLSVLGRWRRRGKLTSRRLSEIVESTSDAIVSLTLDGVIVGWNAGAEALYGYTAREALGRPVSLLVPPDRREEMRLFLEQAARGERVEQRRTVRLRKGSAPLEVIVSVLPVRESSGRIVGASTIEREAGDAAALARECLARPRGEVEAV
jgi:PAS domain S-box-containing protein